MDAIRDCIEFARRQGLGRPQDKQSAADQAAAELAALLDLLAAVREVRNMGDFAIRKHIAAALELYDEQTKGE